jgi:hypothetical protein
MPYGLSSSPFTFSESMVDFSRLQLRQLLGWIHWLRGWIRRLGGQIHRLICPYASPSVMDF